MSKSKKVTVSTYKKQDKKDTSLSYNLTVNVKLAAYIGKSAAIVLQQLYFWLSKANRSYGIIHDNRQWIRNSYNAWQKQIQALSVSTIRRSFEKLETLGIIDTAIFNTDHQFQGGDHVKYFSINFDVLEEIVDGNLEFVRMKRPDISEISGQNIVQMSRVGCAKRTTEDSQNEHPHISKQTIKNKLSNLSCVAHSTSKQKTSDIETKSHEEIFCLSEKNNGETALQPFNEKPTKSMAEKMMDYWNQTIESPSTQISTLSPVLHRFLNQAYAQSFQNTFEQWTAFCDKITTSPFLMGEKNEFSITIQWALKFHNIEKILDGKLYNFGTREKGPKKDRITESHQSLTLSKTIQDHDIHQDVDQDIKWHLEKNYPCPLFEDLLRIRQGIIDRVGIVLYQTWFQSGRIAVHPENQSYGFVLVVRSSLVQQRIEWDHEGVLSEFFPGGLMIEMSYKDHYVIESQPKQEDLSICLTDDQKDNDFIVTDAPVFQEEEDQSFNINVAHVDLALDAFVDVSEEDRVEDLPLINDDAIDEIGQSPIHIVHPIIHTGPKKPPDATCFAFPWFMIWNTCQMQNSKFQREKIFRQHLLTSLIVIVPLCCSNGIRRLILLFAILPCAGPLFAQLDNFILK